MGHELLVIGPPNYVEEEQRDLGCSDTAYDHWMQYCLCNGSLTEDEMKYLLGLPNGLTP